jgi:hypothetical protein
MADPRSSHAERAGVFYPPRAKWYSGLWNFVYVLRRELHLDSLRLPRELGVGAFCLALVLPGYAHCAFGQRQVGRAMMAGYLLGFGVVLVWLGRGPANLAMGSMISLHVISLLYLATRWPRAFTLGDQALLACVLVLVLTLGVYRPLQRAVERHLFLPLRIGERVLVVAANTPSGSVQRGDLIAYRIHGRGTGNVRLGEGFGLGRVEAVAGDTIRFGKEAYTIRGQSRPLRAYMPVGEEWVVPENHWFIWPDSSMTVAGHVANLAPWFQDLALVPAKDFVGKPFARWFGRRQVEP